MMLAAVFDPVTPRLRGAPDSSVMIPDNSHPPRVPFQQAVGGVPENREIVNEVREEHVLAVIDGRAVIVLPSCIRIRRVVQIAARCPLRFVASIALAKRVGNLQVQSRDARFRSEESFAA